MLKTLKMSMPGVKDAGRKRNLADVNIKR